MEDFIMGAIATASFAVALFFLRFWRDTGDRLFAIFSVAFIFLAITRAGLAISNTPIPTEGQTHWYWFRLGAFVLILVAIIDKNRR